MSKEKTQTGDVELTEPGQGATGTIPNRQLQVLSLEIDEDLGGDPYNRTGQFCIVALRNKEQ